MTSLKLLHVEDSQGDSELLLLHLKKAGIVPTYERVETGESFREALMRETWDIVVCDYNLPKFDAFSALKIAKEFDRDLPFVIVSGSVGEEKAVQAMRAGAADYIMKDNLHRFMPVLQREIDEANEKKERRRIEDALKISEENLRQAQKLESIGLLAGGIAHDFNNILAAIILQSEIVSYGLRPSRTSVEIIDDVNKGIDEIKKSAERATGLTRKLLAFSRKQVAMASVVNLNFLISDMREMLNRMVEENIEFEMDLPSGVKNIVADPGHLEQVILNLVVNSRDAMPTGGKLTITTENTVLDSATAAAYNVKPGEYVVLSVSDSGIGISEEIKKNIFEPFFTTKPVGKGTGLGLSTVYGIVKQWNGHITVESNPGAGTCFRIFFQATEEVPSMQKTSESEPSRAKGSETILVVEDEQIIRDLIAGILEKNGYTVLKTANGLRALEVIKANKDIKLVITDVVMPQMGGIELAQKATEFNQKLKFLFQSGYLSKSLDKEGITAGVAHFIQKPYLPKALLLEIRRILNQAGDS